MAFYKTAFVVYFINIFSFIFTDSFKKLIYFTSNEFRKFNSRGFVMEQPEGVKNNA